MAKNFLGNNSPQDTKEVISIGKKFTSTVAGASILLTIVGLISRGLGLIREIVFANSFGLSTAYDLFLVGTVIPLTLNTIVMFIAQNYFIPVYNKLKSNSAEQSKSFIIKSLTIFTAGGIIVMGILYFFSEPIISMYVNNPGIAETKIAVKVLKIYSFTVPFNAAFSLLAAYLYSEFNFKLPTISQLFVNIAVIVSVIIFAGEFGVISIAYGYLLGMILQLGLTFIYIIRSQIHFLSLKETRTKLFYWDPGLVLIIIIEAISQIYLISDRYFLNQVDKGGIAALNYSINIFLLPISIFSIALSTALFPIFSKSYVEKNINQIKDKLLSFFSINLYLFIPITFLMFFFGDEIIKILLQRGAFSSNDSNLTSVSLKYLSISLIFYSIYAVLNKLMYSMELVMQLLIVTIVGCSIKIIGNFIFVSYLKQNGLALSTSISYFYFFIATFFIISKKLSFQHNRKLVGEFILHLIAALISYFIVIIIFNNNQSSLMLSLIAIIFFGFIYLATLWILKTKSILIIHSLFIKTKNPKYDS